MSFAALHWLPVVSRWNHDMAKKLVKLLVFLTVPGSSPDSLDHPVPTPKRGYRFGLGIRHAAYSDNNVIPEYLAL